MNKDFYVDLIAERADELITNIRKIRRIAVSGKQPIDASVTDGLRETMDSLRHNVEMYNDIVKVTA